MVLAGGLGTRVQHLLPALPKPMAPVAERPFLEWVVRYLAQQGVRKVVLSTGYRHEVVAQHFQQNPVPGVRTVCLAEPTPLGTAGGFLQAARASGETPPVWLVLNGDSLALAGLAPALDVLNDPACLGVIVARNVTDASRYGTLVMDPTGALMRFQEKRAGAGLINAGVYLLRHSLVEQLSERTPLSFEQDVFPSLAGPAGKLKVYVMDGPFLDIGTPESLPQAESFVRQHRRFFVED